MKTHFWLLSRQLPPHEEAGPSLIWSAAPEPCDLPQNCWTFSLANEPWTKVSSECTLRKVNKPGDKLQACIMEQKKTSRATGARLRAWKCAGASFLKGDPLDGCFKVAQECWSSLSLLKHFFPPRFFYSEITLFLCEKETGEEKKKSPGKAETVLKRISWNIGLIHFLFLLLRRT